MKKYFLITFLTLGVLVSAAALAAGGGGGGSVPSCTQDQWDCTGWSQCGANALQTRICSLTFNCGNADDPKPAESQSCTPPEAPTPPTPPPAPVEQPTQPIPPPAPSCTKDTYTCGNWSASCDADGREHRLCSLSVDCPNVQTPPPANTQACQRLQCGNKAVLADRISCRLNLTPAGVARELQIQYLPEACRNLIGTEKSECIDIYKSFQPCWAKAEGDSRFSCVRNALSLGPSVAQEAALCRGKTGSEQAECKEDLKEKVLYMITFRFYDLETRAEELTNRGADLQAVADFETIVEMKKQEFYKDISNAARMQIILDVRKAWQDFVAKVAKQVI